MAAARRRTRTPAGSAASGDADGSIDPTALLGDAAGAAQRALRNLGSQVRVPLDSIGSAADSATNLIQRAASVLEEELAAGIVAARRVEGQLLDVNALQDRDDADAELLVRFRRDAHDVIDILVDVAASAVGGIGGIARRAVRISSADDAAPRRRAAPAPAAASSRRDVVASLSVPEPVEPGGTATVAMSVENDGDDPTGNFGFVFSPLVSPTGARIDATQITSTPKRLNLAARAGKRIEVRVDVPESTPSGTYSGLLQASRLDQVRAVLVVTVT